ncbi:hypothetical protein SAMN05216436_106123 [bacterium A37T11]|nr:hypothetical protein SAMN05216436_106123 [bacterium A37T11]
MRVSPAFVFDTNVFVSLALFPGPVIKHAFEKAEALGEIVLSYDTLSELVEVLLRKKFDKYLSVEDRLTFISRVETRYRVIKTTSTITDCRDRKDNILLELAVDVSASCLITGDLDLLDLHPYHGIAILKASDFLQGFSG